MVLKKGLQLLQQNSKLNDVSKLLDILEINGDYIFFLKNFKLGDFCKANPDGPNMTKQKLLDFAKTIDDEFGHLFIPPIR